MELLIAALALLLFLVQNHKQTTVNAA